MLSLIFSFSKSQRLPYDVCVAPRKHAEPVPNGKLIQSQVMIRHGKRAPGKAFGDIKKTGEWICDDNSSYSPRLNPAPVQHSKLYHIVYEPGVLPYQPQCRKEDLLSDGMNDLYELGKFYKSYYVDEMKLLGEAFWPWNVLFRGSEKDRTLRSGVSFMNGMFEPKSPNEVIEYITDNDAAGLVHPSVDWCPELDEASNLYFNSQEWQDIFNSFSNKYKTILESHGIKWNFKNVKKFTAYTLIVDCTNHTNEAWITDEMLLDFARFMSQYNRGPVYYKGNFYGYAGSPMFREFFRVADEKIAMQNDYKFVLYSSHDAALLAILSLLGDYEGQYNPPFGSHVAFEMWDVNGKIMCRFVFNGNPIKLDLFNGETLVSYSNLKMKFASNGYLSHCIIPNWPK